MAEAPRSDSISSPPISLWALAERIRFPWFRWWAATRFDRPKDVARAMARLERRHPDIPGWDRGRLLEAELRTRRFQVEMRRIVVMSNKILPVVRGCLGTEFFRFQGMLAGKIAVIDRSVAQTALIDIEAGTVALLRIPVILNVESVRS